MSLKLVISLPLHLSARCFMVGVHVATDQSVIRLITYNMQVAIGSHRLHHLLSHGLRYLLPHAGSLKNLDRIAEQVLEADFVALNEADAGSFRTKNINQALYIARKDGYLGCEQMITRDLGYLAQHSNSLLSRDLATKVVRHRLPRPNDGRGVLEVHFLLAGRPLVVFVTHLSLSRRIREVQFAYLATVVTQYQDVVLMGDLNCTLDSPELREFMGMSNLLATDCAVATFPSWRPARAIDHILISSRLSFQTYHVLSEPLADHLALYAELGWSV